MGDTLIISLFSGSIGIPMKFSINTIQSYIQEPLPSPAELEQLFTFHLCEVEGLESCPDGDMLIDLNILPNRAHDMLGHYGVARELAGQLGLTLKPLLVGVSGEISEQSSLASADYLNNPVRGSIQTDKCTHYMARKIEGVIVRDSEQVIIDDLAKLGQRSINNIVDATNTVMFLTGQPTHVFDADKITGGITVRMAIAGEMITLLDGKEMELDESVMVIADDVAVLAIAGIKGGKHAEVDSNTKNIILEVANFDASTIRKTAQKLGLRTDASYRFERDISPSLCGSAMAALTGYIIAVASDSVEPSAIGGTVTDVYPVPQQTTSIEFNLADVSRVAGVDIGNADITNMLQRYGFAYVERDGNFSVTIPLWRLDLVGRHDMIEEVIRIRGVDKIVPIAPSILSLQPNKVEELIAYIRRHLLGVGYSEVMTYSFRDSGQSRVLASAGDKSYLRTSLTTGMRESQDLNERNKDLLGLDIVRQFEMGTVFGKDDEAIHLCISTSVKNKQTQGEPWKVLSDMLYDLGLTEKMIHECLSTEDCMPTGENVNSQFLIECNLSRVVDSITRIPQYVQASIPPVQVMPFRPWSKYPYITRDIAVWTPEGTNPEVLEKLYTSAAGELLACSPRLVDQFTKDGRTSYAFRLVFQSYDHTLTDAEVEPVMAAVTRAAVEQGWEVR